MATTINADTVTGGAIVTGDASGQLELQAAGVTKLTVAAGGVTLASPLPVASGGTGGTATPTAGGIVYGTGTVQAVTAAGTSGQVLQSNGVSAPTWVTPSSGALVFLSSVTASSSATVDLETTFSSTYDAYIIIASGVISATSGTSFNCRLKLGGAYATSSYSYHSSITSASSASYSATASDTAAAQIVITSAMGNTTADSVNFTMTINNPSSTTNKKVVYWIGGSQDASTSLNRLAGAGSGNAITALTGVRFLAGSGNITSGTFRLYGIANS